LYSASNNNKLSKNTANGNDMGFYVELAAKNRLTSNTANSNVEYGYFDLTTGSGTAGTANAYSLDECSSNLVGGSSPTGLCAPQP